MTRETHDVYASRGTLSSATKRKTIDGVFSLGFCVGGAIPAGLFFALCAWLAAGLAGGASTSTRLAAAIGASIACAVVYGYGNANGGPFPGPFEQWAQGVIAYIVWSFAWAMFAEARAARRVRASRPSEPPGTSGSPQP